MQLSEALSEHLQVVGGVWFQHRQFVAGLVAVGLHDSPLLSAHHPEHIKVKKKNKWLNFVNMAEGEHM